MQLTVHGFVKTSMTDTQNSYNKSNSTAFCTACSNIILTALTAFSAFTLLVGWQEGHLARKKAEWCGAGMVICLERGADLHTAQLMPLPLTISCLLYTSDAADE